MNRKIKVAGKILSLTDKQYLASGGEGEIYVNSGTSYKIYHDPAKKMLPTQKMQELSTISNPQVVVPQEIIYDANNGSPLGYTTTFIDNSEPLLKLFTRTFKDDNNVGYPMITDLVKKLQLIMADVHTAKCLIVDFNELNVLAQIGSNGITPWFIDTDSYCTPSFKATAIMNSVKDFKCSKVDSKGVLHYNPTIESDWFSWAIISFWLYTNCHPFRGSHPNYKPKDKLKQMEDGISVFHKDVKVPPSANSFKVIPSRHFDYFKRVFLNGERGIPPLSDSSVPLLVPTAIVTIKGTDKLDVIDISSFSGTITSIYEMMGISHVVTKTHVYFGKTEMKLDKHYNKVLIGFSNDTTPIIAKQDGHKIQFETNRGQLVGFTNSGDMFARNGVIYTIANNKLMENSFFSFNGKVIHKMAELENVSLSAKMYDGCVIQSLLGKTYLAIPYKPEHCFSKYVKELDGYRIIDAKSDKTVTVVLAEKGGKYARFVIVFDKNYTDFNVRIVSDVAYDNIVFATMANGLCVLLNDQSQIEIFFNNSKIEILDNPPFDSNMKLFTTSNGIFFSNDNSLHQLKKK